LTWHHSERFTLQAPPLSDVLGRIELHRVYDVHEVSALLDALAARWAAPSTSAAAGEQLGVHSPAAGGRLGDQLPGLIGDSASPLAYQVSVMKQLTCRVPD
jgi:hypothetical protein